MQIPRLRLRTKIALILSLCAAFIFAINFLLLGEQESIYEQHLSKEPNSDGFPTSALRLPRAKKEYVKKIISTRKQSVLFSDLEASLLDKLKHIPEIHLQMKLGVRQLVEELSRDLKNKTLYKFSPWKIASKWVNELEIFPPVAPELGNVLHAMTSLPIMKATFADGGSQLKILLHLQGGQHVVFKPKKYERDEVIYGNSYAGADRHNGEIAAFHLARLLDMRWSPLVVGRRINLNDQIIPVAEKDLLKTFLNKAGNTCFYAKCTYCEPSYAACADGDIMEGSIILWLPLRIQSYAHPWRRTYKPGKFAAWELNNGYCSIVMNHPMYAEGSRLLNLIDVAIFDFLIGNADRHHYHTFAGSNNSRVLLLDNGKSFGNPYEDEVSILAPLLQCCIVRQSTWERLQIFTGQALSQTLKDVMSHDPLSPVLAEVHLWSLDRRLLKVLAAVELCVQSKGNNYVFQKEIFR